MKSALDAKTPAAPADESGDMPPANPHLVATKPRSAVQSKGGSSGGSAGANGASAYLKTKVLTASPLELRQMLVDGAIRFADIARGGIESRNYEAMYTGVTRCQAILMELINALRPEHDPELCRRLSSLYTYMYTRLMRVSTERNVAILDEVLRLLRYERETWDMVQAKLVEENAAAARLQHTPHASPPVDPALQPKPANLIGATVSLRG